MDASETRVSRRTFTAMILASSGLAAVPTRAQEAQTQITKTSTAGDLAALAGNPYVQAAVAVVSAINSQEKAHKDAKAFREIGRQLASIERKVDELLLAVHNIPEAVDRKFNAQIRDTSIRAYRVECQYILSVLSKYPVRPASFTPEDKSRLRNSSDSIFRYVMALGDWGRDTFLWVGEAYAYMLLLRDLVGVSGPGIPFTQTKFGEIVEAAIVSFAQNHADDQRRLAYLEENLRPIGGVYYFGDILSWSIYYPVSGDPDHGFKLGRQRPYTRHGNPLRKPTVASIGPEWKSYRPGHALIVGENIRNFVKKANLLSNEYRAVRLHAQQEDDLERSSRMVLEAIRTQA